MGEVLPAASGIRTEPPVVAGYREAKLSELIEQVRQGLAAYGAGEIGRSELGGLIEQYVRAVQELRKFCAAPGTEVETLSRIAERWGEGGSDVDWWAMGAERPG